MNGAGSAASSSSLSLHVGKHVVRVAQAHEGRWHVYVDGLLVASSHESLSEAVRAGVREADRLDGRGGAGS